MADAYRRIHELDGLAHFRLQQYEQALNEFNLAGGEQALSPASLPCYKQAQEYVDYTSARNRNTEGALRAFLTNYPYSCYSKEISNLLALAIAQSITIYSYDSAGAEALSYAKDSSTRQAVQRYIDWQKKNYKLYCKRNRMAARRANGNIIQFGLEWMDVGFNPSCYDDTDNDLDIVWFYNVGLGLKFGNYNTPVQFLLGAKIGLVGYTVWYDYNDESKTCFHLPLFAKLKVNVCNISKSAKLLSMPRAISMPCGTSLLKTNLPLRAVLALPGSIGTGPFTTKQTSATSGISTTIILPLLYHTTSKTRWRGQALENSTLVPANGFSLATDGGYVLALGAGGVGDGGADGLDSLADGTQTYAGGGRCGGRSGGW